MKSPTENPNETRTLDAHPARDENGMKPKVRMVLKLLSLVGGHHLLSATGFHHQLARQLGKPVPTQTSDLTHKQRQPNIQRAVQNHRTSEIANQAARLACRDEFWY